MPSNYACCCARSSPRRVVRTTTGTHTTRRWWRNVARPCSSRRRASTATADASVGDPLCEAPWPAFISSGRGRRVEDDRLRLEEVHEAFLAALASDARLLEAAERDPE